MAQIAERLERTEVSSRVVMNRPRDRILPQLFEPLRTRLPGDAWVIAEQILVRRVEVDQFCQAVGVGEALVRHTLAERVIPALFDEYGAASAEMLLRLTGLRH